MRLCDLVPECLFSHGDVGRGFLKMEVLDLGIQYNPCELLSLKRIDGSGQELVISAIQQKALGLPFCLWLVQEPGQTTLRGLVDQNMMLVFAATLVVDTRVGGPVWYYPVLCREGGDWVIRFRSLEAKADVGELTPLLFSEF